MAHGSVFHSDHRTAETTDVTVFALAPSSPISISGLVPECTATAEHPAATSRSISVPTIPSCTFAGAETLLAAAHADGIYPEPVYTSDHPTCSVSAPAIPSHAFATAHANGIVSAIGPTCTFVTDAASSPVAVPATVDRKSAPTSPPPVAIAHLALALAPATAPLRPTLDSESIPASVSAPPSVPAIVSASESAVSFNFPVAPAVSISTPAVIVNSVASCVFASAPAPLLTCSPLATHLPITTPSPNTTNVASEIPNVAFKISALTYVPQIDRKSTRLNSSHI